MFASWNLATTGNGMAYFHYGDGTNYSFSNPYTGTRSRTFQIWCGTNLTKTYTQKVTDGPTGAIIKTATTTLKKTTSAC